MIARQRPTVLSENIGDANLQYLEYEGPQPTLVMLHATGFLPWLWHPIAAKLAGRHRVVAPYFCDHRIIDADKGGLDWVLLAEDLSKLCRQLKIDRPILVGHSMGGSVMTYAQALFGLNAQAMILIEPIFFPKDYYRMEMSPEEHPLASKSLKRRNHWDSAAEVKAYLKTKPLFANWEEEFLDLYIKHGTMGDEDGGLELACAPPREAAIYMGDKAHDPWPLMSRIKCPVLVIEGAQSSNRQHVDLPAAAARFPSGRFQRIAGAGHLIPMEKPKDVLQSIFDFVQSTEGRRDDE
jgi:pimeloyl-ACP methyl ester carboxylesterase